MLQFGALSLVSLIKPVKHIALVDCNNFYVSCERAFQPAWNDKPVGILSNNDGCIVSRSNELKQAGIPMGSPYFKYKQKLQDMGAIIVSSNYALYGDMSNRVMHILSKFTPKIEVYSIDEAWLDLTGFKDTEIYAEHIASYTHKTTAIPVSVGVAPTKTLAKIMCHYIKKSPASDNSLVYPTQKQQQDTLLGGIKVEDIWGIGKRWGQALRSIGIYTAQDLRDAPSVMLRKKFNVIMLKTQSELQGVSCFEEDDCSVKKQIISSRSFGKRVTQKEDLREAIAMHIATATKKLREQGSVCGAVIVKIRTSPFSESFYVRSAVYEFDALTSDTLLIIQYAFGVLDSIYKPNKLYAKAGIVLCDIRPRDCYQGSLFGANDTKQRQNLMKTIDSINNRFGRDTLIYGSEGLYKSWRMKNKLKTPAYTTNWHDIFSVD